MNLKIKWGQKEEVQESLELVSNLLRSYEIGFARVLEYRWPRQLLRGGAAGQSTSARAGHGLSVDQHDCVPLLVVAAASAAVVVLQSWIRVLLVVSCEYRFNYRVLTLLRLYTQMLVDF